MSQGRYGEQLRAQASLMNEQLMATGEADASTAMGLQGLVGRVFKGGELGKGARGREFLGRLQGTMTQGGPMRSFMMRAIGYGSDPNMGYIDMRKRLEKGIHDPENLIDFFGALQNRGLGKGGMFRALESVSGGKMKAHEISNLVDELGNEKGLAKFKEAHAQGNAETFLSGLSDPQRQAYEKGGMGALGKTKGMIAAGEYRGVQLEGMQMQVGRPIATVMADMTTTLQNVAGMFGDVLGGNPLELLTDLSGAIKELSKTGKNLTDQIPQELTAKGQVGQRMGHMSMGIAVGNVAGPVAASQFLAAANLGVLGLPIPEGLVTDPVARDALKRRGLAGKGGK
jgi:hypothetical protein